MSRIAITTNYFCKAFLFHCGYRVYLFQELNDTQDKNISSDLYSDDFLVDISDHSCMVRQLIDMMGIFIKIPCLASVKIICDPKLNKILTILFASFFSSMHFYSDKMKNSGGCDIDKKSFRLYHDQSLTLKEIRVLYELMCGLSTSDVEKLLGISNKVISTHKTRAIAKLGYPNLNNFIYCLSQWNKIGDNSDF